MKRIFKYTIHVESDGKTDFGIKFLTSCLENVIHVLDGYKKNYRVKVMEKVEVK